MADKQCDLVVVGAGPAGLTAGLYASRSMISTVILERMLPGGQAATTSTIENYPGFPKGIGGLELAELLAGQARNFGAEIVTADVQKLELTDEGRFRAITADGVYRAKAAVAASGSDPRPLGVPGEDGLRGRGVSYCATCDGAFYRDRRVMVIGGGDSAVEEALYLTRFASEVTIVHRRDKLRAARALRERAFASPKIRFIWDSVVERIIGHETVEAVAIRNVKTGETREVPSDGVFVYVGNVPNVGYLPDTVDRDDAGYVITDDDMRTSVKGLFAAGDVRRKSLRQVATAVGDGAVAAVSAEKYIESLEE